MTVTGPAPAAAVTSVPGMSTGEVLTRFDVVTDKMATRLDAAVDKVTTRLDGQGDRLARIEEKVNMVPADLAALHTSLGQVTNRVRVLESKWAFLAGVGAVCTLLLTSGVVAAILTAVHK